MLNSIKVFNVYINFKVATIKIEDIFYHLDRRSLGTNKEF